MNNDTAKASDTIGELYARVQAAGLADQSGHSQEYCFIYSARGCSYCIWTDDETAFQSAAFGDGYTPKLVHVSFTSRDGDRDWSVSDVVAHGDRVIDIVRRARRSHSERSA